MPTYDYVCDACGHEYELVQSMKDSPIKKCPHCKKLKAQRLIGRGAGVIFKGSGFYQTDYKNKGSKSSSKESSSKGSSSGDTCCPHKDKKTGKTPCGSKTCPTD